MGTFLMVNDRRGRFTVVFTSCKSLVGGADRPRVAHETLTIAPYDLCKQQSG
jgi:hypothetical protein